MTLVWQFKKRPKDYTPPRDDYALSAADEALIEADIKRRQALWDKRHKALTFRERVRLLFSGNGAWVTRTE